MTTEIESIDELLIRIAGMTTTEESIQVHEAIAAFKRQATDDEYQQVRRALSVRLNQLADQFEGELNETADQLRIEGKTYDLADWLTIANYAKKYKTTTHVVTNWVRRGTIPTDDVLTLTAINNIRMVKDRVYE